MERILDKLQSTGLLEQLEKSLSCVYETLPNDQKEKENIKLILAILGTIHTVDEVWIKKDKEKIMQSRGNLPRSPPKLKRVSSPQIGKVRRASIGEAKSVSPLHQARGSLSTLLSAAGDGDFNSGLGYSFPKESRLPQRASDSPGPAYYSPSISHTKARSPNRSFSKNHRTTEILNPESSPGPVYNPHLRFLSK